MMPLLALVGSARIGSHGWGDGGEPTPHGILNNGVVVVQAFGEPLLGDGLLIELEISVRK